MAFNYADHTAWSRARGAQAPSPENLEAADAVVRSIGAAPAPQVLRQFHGETADGKRVSMYSQRWPEDVFPQLEEQAGAPLVRFWHSHKDLPFGPYQPKTTSGEKYLSAIASVAQPTPIPAPRPTLPAAAASVPTFDFSGTPGFSMEAFAAMFMAQGWLPPGAAAPANGFHGYTIDPNLRLSDRMTDFLNLVRQKKTSRSRVVDYAATLHIFKELVGDLPLAELKPSHTDVFLEAMRVWPSHASKRREFRNMEAPAVVRKAQMLRQTPIDLRTQQQHVGRLRAFFIYLERRHEIRPDLLRGIRLVTKKTPTNRSRLPFDEAQLDTIFASPQITGTDEPFKFWLPMLALYTGARVRELAQLYVDDVSERDGDWFISIAQNRPGQRLKNLQSERMVPVHNRLIAAGFLEYVEDARRAGLVRLFPGLNWQAANGPGDQVSDWFNRTLRKQIGIQGWELTFHSFRHCFATFASRSQVRDILIEELLGHDTGHSTLNTYYVGLSHLKEKRRALNLIAFPPLIHTVYRRGRFDRVFHQATRAQARAAQIASVYPASP